MQGGRGWNPEAEGGTCTNCDSPHPKSVEAQLGDLIYNAKSEPEWRHLSIDKAQKTIAMLARLMVRHGITLHGGPAA